MEAFPEASSSKDVKGMTPLHYLCSSKRATAAMVKSLVAFDEETAEEEAEREMLPLHFACKVSNAMRRCLVLALNVLSPPTFVLCCLGG